VRGMWGQGVVMQRRWRMRVGLVLGCLCGLWVVPVVHALGPHEVVLVVNRAVPESVEVAEHYRALRKIPASHVVMVDVPWEPTVRAQSPEAWRTQIFNPVSEAIVSRGLDKQILAWVYSVGFPTRMTTPKPISLHGMTWLRGELPTPEQISEALYESPLFAGGAHDDRDLNMTQSLDSQARWIGSQMPLPAMSLGVIGERGSTVAQVKAQLTRAAQCDSTRPKGTIYLMDGKDVRIRVRSWQFAATVHALELRGVRARVVPVIPADADSVLGVFTGVASTDPSLYTFLPGAIADNLTSFGGAFDSPSQTKLTSWLNAGAVACAGTVAEPMSHYRKFPIAQIYVHYAAGCTVLEAYVQSIISPLQQLLVGDPLAAPFAHHTELALVGMPADGVLRESTSVGVTVEDPLHYNRRQFTFLLDGRVVGEAKEWELQPKALTLGTHTLRAVAFTYGSMRSQCFVETTFEVVGADTE
jgi:uncharacterized protein (TIGR03790 family)